MTTVTDKDSSGPTATLFWGSALFPYLQQALVPLANCFHKQGRLNLMKPTVLVLPLRGCLPGPGICLHRNKCQ